MNPLPLRARKSARKIENSMRSKISRGFEAINISFKCRIQGFVLVTSFTSIDWLAGWLELNGCKKIHETCQFLMSPKMQKSQKTYLSFCCTRSCQLNEKNGETCVWQPLAMWPCVQTNLVRIMRACLVSRVFVTTNKLSGLFWVRNAILKVRPLNSIAIDCDLKAGHSLVVTLNAFSQKKSANSKRLNFATRNKLFCCTNFQLWFIVSQFHSAIVAK